jgi:hypothetical protein
MSNRDGTAVSFPLQPRKGTNEEVVTVKVTDTNGIEILATTTIVLPKVSQTTDSPITNFFSSAITSLLHRMLSPISLAILSKVSSIACKLPVSFPLSWAYWTRMACPM